MSMSEMQQGWDFAVHVLGANAASYSGAGYVNGVNEAIKALENNINNHQYRNQGIGQLQGYMLEEWSAGTFNVDAVAAGSKDRASVLGLNSKYSVDIHLDSGSDYSAKSYQTAKDTANAQAKFNSSTGKAVYDGQGRLIPSDQLAEAKQAAHKQALRNQDTREAVSKAYSETESKLTDHLKNDEGVQSKSASRKELEKIADESKKQKFKAEDHGVTAQSAIKPEYLLKKAMKAGLTAAAITVAVQLAPEIIKSIDYLIKNGEINFQQIQQMGLKGISAGAESFLQGSISSSLQILSEAGALGAAFKAIDPTIMGTVVVLVMQTVKNSILVAAGKMTAREMGTAFVDTVVISGGYLLGTQIGGIIGQAIGFELPVVGYLLGSLIGTAFSVLYNIGKNKFISFCIDTGFTCFGLVDQNYELPEEMLKELNVDTIPIPRSNIDTIDIPRINVATAAIERTQYETVGFTMVKRGVIGVNKIGYVLA